MAPGCGQYRLCIKRDLLLHSQQTQDVDPMLAHCLRRWPSIKPALVQRLVFAELCSIARWSGNAYCWRRVQAGTDPMSVKCWASDAGQYPFSAQLVFIQRSARRRWVKCISQSLGQRLVWAASARKIETAGPLCVQRGRHNY